MTDKIILTEAMIRKAIVKAAQRAVSETIDRLKRKLRRSDIIDRLVEDAIPHRYSGHSRERMKDLVKSRVRENLRKEKIK